MMLRLFAWTLLIASLVTGSTWAQEQTNPDSLATAATAVSSLADTSIATTVPGGGVAATGISLDTIWKMTEQAGGMRWLIYAVFFVGVLAIIFKIIQLILDSRYTKPFIKQKSEEEEQALQAETIGETLKNMLEYKIKSHSPDAIVGLASRYPKSKVAQLLRTLGDLASRTKNAVAFQEEISSFVRREKDHFEVWRGFVVLMSDTAGALGLLGTVWGMYLTFLGGKLEPEQILTGMGIALVTTLLGLVVSITLNIISTGVLKMFNNRLELMEFAGDVFRAQFAESEVITATGSAQPIMQMPAYVAPPHVVAETPAQLLAERVPTKLVLTSSSEQEGEVNSRLSRPVEVQVLDQDDEGLAKQRVRFEANGSDLILANGKHEEEVVTDSKGRARVNVTLGKSVGVQTLIARLASNNGVADLTEEVTIVSRSGPPNSIAPLPAVNHQVGLLKEKLPVDFGVKLTDEFSNPIIGQPVVFRVITNEVVRSSGRFSNRKSEIEIDTDDQGIASTPFWLGEEVGPNIVRIAPKHPRGSDSPELLIYATGKDA